MQFHHDHRCERRPRKTMTRLLTASALVSALVLSGAASVTATHGQPDHGVPVHAEFIGGDHVAIPPPDCPDDAMWRYYFDGTGNMSHLGDITMSTTHCTFFDPSIGGGSFGPGVMIVTAANGDTLTLGEGGTFTFDGINSVVALEWWVIGGTGRFDGASGGGTGTLAGHIPTATTSGELFGTLIYDASGRSGK